jgi:hypothetical protein
MDRSENDRNSGKDVSETTDTDKNRRGTLENVREQQGMMEKIQYMTVVHIDPENRILLSSYSSQNAAGNP